MLNFIEEEKEIVEVMRVVVGLEMELGLERLEVWERRANCKK